MIRRGSLLGLGCGALFATLAFGATPTVKSEALKAKMVELCKAGKYGEALPLALELHERVLREHGPSHLETAFSLHHLGEIAEEAGDKRRALAAFEAALVILEKVRGPEHEETATCLHNLGGVCHDLGDYPRAFEVLRRALVIREKKTGLESRAVATTLNSIGAIHVVTGELAKAEPLLLRALAIYEKVIGPEHPSTASAINNLAALYSDLGQFQRAEPFYRRALAIREKTLGPDHVDLAASLNNFATFHYKLGRAREARVFYERSLAILERTLGRDHPLLGTSLNNLASLARATGDFAQAVSLHQRSIAITEKALGRDHAENGSNLSNLALLYFELGDYDRARPLMERSVAILEKSVGPEHPMTIDSLNNLASLDRATGNLDHAQKLFERLVAASEKSLGADHPDTAVCLGNLGNLLRERGDLSGAQRLLERALRIHEKATGTDRTDAGHVLNNLAGIAEDRGDFATARRQYVRALAIGDRTLGPEHPDILSALENVALLDVREGRLDEARPLAARAAKVMEHKLANVLSFASESQRLEFQKTVLPYTLPASLGDARALATTLLRWKGVVLDSLLEDRAVAAAASDTALRALLGELRATRQRLTELRTGAGDESSAARHAAELELVAASVERLESELAAKVAVLGRTRRALAVDVPAVQRALAADEALVEFLYYPDWARTGKLETHYGAIVMTATGEPRWFPLAEAAALDRQIALFQRSARGGTDASTLERTLSSLYQTLCAPITATLPKEVHRLVLSPDSELNFVSFSALLAPSGRFLAEEFEVRYVASGRDLLRTAPRVEDRRAVIAADPDFSRRGGKPAKGGPGDGRFARPRATDTAALKFAGLPGTGREAGTLARLARSRDWTVDLRLGTAASERALHGSTPPRLLHLATHGFFLPRENSGPARTANPMHRCGLALAGAQRTVEAWARNEVPPPGDDGILTAEEVGTLQLEGTWLVTLSACETGFGEVRSGEGVLGLRRGFIQAGAQNLLMTLWPIDDEATVDIMRDFYSHAFGSGDAPGALAEVQRDWLVKLRAAEGLQRAVNRAGAFILSSQGMP